MGRVLNRKPSTMTSPWLNVAEKYIGLKEIVGPQHNKKILEFYKNSGAPQIKDDETAWCAAFVGQCLFEAGYPNTRSLMARSYINYGTKCEPKPGAIVVFPRGSNPAQGHVGIVKSVNGGSIRIISGNDSNQVKESTRTIASALAFRWPPVKPSNTAKAAVEAPAAMGFFGLAAYYFTEYALPVLIVGGIITGLIIAYRSIQKD
jgi:uncharacterized protein (TIGR02594 family)